MAVKMDREKVLSSVDVGGPRCPIHDDVIQYIQHTALITQITLNSVSYLRRLPVHSYDKFLHLP